MFENIPSILISIQPQWCEKIFEIIGENENKAPVYKKRIEVRKTRPKYPTPFKVYIYCTKGKFALLRKDNEYRHDHWEFAEFHKSCGNEILNGKVIAEFICDEITEMYVGKIGEKVKDGYICLDTTSDVLRSQACLTEKQLISATIQVKPTLLALPLFADVEGNPSTNQKWYTFEYKSIKGY